MVVGICFGEGGGGGLPVELWVAGARRGFIWRWMRLRGRRMIWSVLVSPLWTLSLSVLDSRALTFLSVLAVGSSVTRMMAGESDRLTQ